jgi:glucoamylase
MSVLKYESSIVEVDPRANANPSFMFSLMFRNIASSGWVIRGSSGRMSKPGCIIASPSFPSDFPGTEQDYAFHWTRDAAIVVMELAARHLPSTQVLEDYVAFSRLTQTSSLAAGKNVGFACYRVDGTPRDGNDPSNPSELAWGEQGDGPALRVLSLIEAWGQLSSPSQATAREIIRDDCAYLLANCATPKTNLWEETDGLSFFTRSVQLKCFKALADRNDALKLELGKHKLNAAIADLTARLGDHWQTDHYVSVLGSDGQGADLNADVVMACIYGDIPCFDPKILATAAKIRSYFQEAFSVNKAPDSGPLIGRYPGDTYDGDASAPGESDGHPWLPCTCVFAELYYRVAQEIAAKKSLTIELLAKPFFDQLGIDDSTAWQEASIKLRTAGDDMLNAVVFHSDHMELSEQFDRSSGFEKSVRDLTWSYSSYLSAVRARQAIPKTAVKKPRARSTVLSSLLEPMRTSSVPGFRVFR